MRTEGVTYIYLTGFFLISVLILGIILIVTFISLASAAMDPNVCSQFNPGTNEPKKPNMTAITSYKVRVEANIVNRNYTAEYVEYFDYPNQRAATHVVIGGGRSDNIYSFKTNELLHIDRTTDICTVSTLANSSNLVTFGQQTGPNKTQIFTTAGALRFSGNISEKWINQTSVRGIPCNLWRSCVYVSQHDATMVVDWYFSVPGWSSAERLDQVPIRAHIKGVSNTPNQQHEFEHFYDFVDFKTTFSETKPFETPEGAYCPNRKTKRQLPVPAKAFHFSSEVLDMNSNRIGQIKEWYDYNLNLVRFDLTPMTYSPYGPNPQTKIHDFNTGVSYTIDQHGGNCSVTNISNVGFDVHNIDPTHVRLRTAQEFFYFDRTAYNYEGTRRARGILCDVWITRRTDWPPTNTGYPSTWEWYFAVSNYTVDLPDKLSFGMPIRLEIVLTVTTNIKRRLIYNFYAYDEQQPVVWDYDIGKCFNYTSRKDFAFLLPGNFRDLAGSDMERFKYYVLTEIQAVGGISALRASNIQVDYTNNSDITVRFTLLDRPPPIGNVEHPKLEPDLNTVATQLSTAINNGTFKVKMTPQGQTNVTVMIAKPNSLTPTQHIVHVKFVQNVQQNISVSSGYSGGVMAGMGVGLLVVCFVLAVIAMYFFYRKQGGAFLPKKFDNVDITTDVS